MKIIQKLIDKIVDRTADRAAERVMARLRTERPSAIGFKHGSPEHLYEAQFHRTPDES